MAKRKGTGKMKSSKTNAANTVKKHEDSKGVFGFIISLLVGFFKSIAWVIRKFIDMKHSYDEKKEEIEIKKHRKKLDEISNYVPLDVVQKDYGDFEKFERKIIENKSTIGIILGARGTGKSAIGMRLLENLYNKSERNSYCMGFMQEDLPGWLKVVDNINEIARGGIVLIDEGGILYSARKSLSEANTLLSEALLIARHNDLSIIFISQNSANLEINALRQADYLVLKPSSLLQKDFERKKIKEIYDETSKDFEKYKDDRGITYIYSNEFRGFVSNKLPSFWNVSISKSFSRRKKKE